MKSKLFIALNAFTVAFALTLTLRSRSDQPVLWVGHGVTAPRPLNNPDPEYSEEAREAGLEGTCILSVVVNSEGKPEKSTSLAALEWVSLKNHSLGWWRIGFSSSVLLSPPSRAFTRFALFSTTYETSRTFPRRLCSILPEANQARRQKRRYATTNRWFADICSVGIGVCAGPEWRPARGPA